MKNPYYEGTMAWHVHGVLRVPILAFSWARRLKRAEHCADLCLLVRAEDGSHASRAVIRAAHLAELFQEWLDAPFAGPEFFANRVKLIAALGEQPKKEKS